MEILLYLLAGIACSAAVYGECVNKKSYMPVTFYVVNIFCWPLIMSAFVYVNYIHKDDR